MEILIIAFALAMDSVALSIANGAKFRNMSFFVAVKMSLVYGFFQGLMPFLGYFLGSIFVSYVASIDHYIAFVILCFLGFKMIKESCSSECEEGISSLDFKEILAGAVATSIDAMAVGVTFAFGDVEIFSASLIIALVCFVLCVMAVFVGRRLGDCFGRKSLVLGGVILILIGSKILLEHLGIL